MSDIHDLEQRLQALEDAFAEQSGKIDRLLEKSDKALDLAIHAYKVDHYGFIWQYDCEAKEYVKSNMRVCTPEIADRALHSRHIADGAVEGRHLQDDCIDGTKIAPNTIPGRCIADESITGDHMDGEIVLPGKLASDSVLTRNIKDKNVTPDKLADNVYDVFVKPTVVILNKQIAALQQEDGRLHDKDDDLQNQIDSFNEHGISVSNKFGQDPHIGMSQKKLTEAFNLIWLKLEEVTGETLLGFTWTVTPTYIHGEWPTTVHISAVPVNGNDVLEKVELFVNNVKVDEVTEDITSYSFDIDLQESADIKLIAQVLGVPYTRQEYVSHYNSFWVGAGQAYADVMVEADQVDLSQARIVKDVTAADGDHIFIIIGDTIRPGFIRADINGIEIPFDETSVTIGGKGYRILASQETYEAGTYNIDING